MTRSSKKGPYVDERLSEKSRRQKTDWKPGLLKRGHGHASFLRKWLDSFSAFTTARHIEVLVNEDMVGHRLGEFSPTKKFIKHGGKMQKELEQKKKEGEIAAAQAAKAPRHRRCQQKIIAIRIKYKK